MQLNVIRGGSPQMFNALLFPEAPPETKEWIREQFNNASSHLTEMGRNFMEGAADLYRRLNDPMIAKMARRAVRGFAGLGHPNMIAKLTTITEIQAAKPVMQRYIMALPELRRLYHQQRCDGYSDSYVDHQPGKVGDAHYDYCRVMNGIIQEYQDEAGNDTWKVVMYPDDLEEGDRELDLDEQSAILTCWEIAREALRQKIDPSDVFNGKLE